MRVDYFSQAKELGEYWVSQNVAMRDGVVLHYAVYMAAQPSRGHALILLDHGEFIEKYCEVAEDLARRGWQAWCLEWRGQGRYHTHTGETGEEGEASGNEANEASQQANTLGWFDVSVSDFDEFWQRVWLPETQEKPGLILAHGIGAHLLLRWMFSNRRRDFGRNAMILTAPMLRPWSVQLPVFIGYLLSLVMNALNPLTPYPGQERESARDKNFATNRLTQDETRFRIFERWREMNPELMPRPRSSNWLASAMHSSNRLRRDLVTGGTGWTKWFSKLSRLLTRRRKPCLARKGLKAKYRAFCEVVAEFRKTLRLNVPTLALLTPADEIVDGYSQYLLAGRFARGRIVDFSDARHDLLHERDDVRDRVWDEMDKFILKVFG